jgi:hypothetical protein
MIVFTKSDYEASEECMDSVSHKDEQRGIGRFPQEGILSSRVIQPFNFITSQVAIVYADVIDEAVPIITHNPL